MRKILARIWENLKKRGVLCYVAYIYPVWWTQDMDFMNNGYDILTLRSTGKAYFKGTRSQRSKEFSA